MMRIAAPHGLVRLLRLFAEMTAWSRAEESPQKLKCTDEVQLRRTEKEGRRVAAGQAKSRMPENLTTRELAAKWRKSEWTIREYAKSGRILGAHKIGRDWLFPLNPQIRPLPDTATETAAVDLVTSIDTYLSRI